MFTGATVPTAPSCSGKGGKENRKWSRGFLRGPLVRSMPAIISMRRTVARCAADEILQLARCSSTAGSEVTRLSGFAGRVLTSLFDDDRAFHVRVELAEVFECPGRVEGLGERFARGDGAGLQRFAIEAGRRVGGGSLFVQVTLPPTGTVVSGGL